MSERILYIEDDDAQALLVKKRLQREGYAVDVAGDGLAGLALYAHSAYDAVVVDQTMPGMNGLDVISAMRLRGPLPPTIMVTGTGDERIAVAAMKAGISDYLVKDLHGGFVNMLPLVIRRAIGQRRLLLEKRRMEQELAQAQRMKTIGQISAGMAHEINTPTQYIGDNARFLQNAFADIDTLLGAFDRLLRAAQNNTLSDELLNEVETKLRAADLDYLRREIPQAIQQSLEGVDHVAGIVGAMNEFAHPGAGRRHFVDLNRVIQDAITISRNEWKCAAQVLTDYDPELPPVYCLPSDINRVVLNLIVNAAHTVAEAAPTRAGTEGLITVRTRRDGPWAEIRVEDTGTGIPEEIRARVFDPFFTTKKLGHGTGQGLAIARAIAVEGHGGSIHFETQLGRGTTFIVRLPINPQPENPQEDAADEEPVEQLELAAQGPV